MIFLEDKIIVPKKLRIPMTELLHRGHIGINKTIYRARNLFYWPELAADITEYVKNCRVCEKHRPNNFREPMLPHSIPKLRFNKVGADILEYGPSSYLVVVDYFSHWLKIWNERQNCILSYRRLPKYFHKIRSS